MELQSTYEDQFSSAISRIKDDVMNLQHWTASLKFCKTKEQKLELLSNIERTSEKLERYSREWIKELQRDE